MPARAQTHVLGSRAEGVERQLFLEPLPDLIHRLSHFRRLERAWHVIEEHYTDPDLGLERAARESATSKNHLNVLLRQETGFTFYQLLIRYRLSRAIAMMEAGNLNLLEIALENGFASLTAFERSFRRLIGSTPSTYRRDHGSTSSD